MHSANPQDFKPLSTSQADLLRRISREMDRFMIQLTQIESVAAELIAAHKTRLPEGTSACLQSIDYVSQASMALSMLLTHMADEPDAGTQQLLQDVVPHDLRERLCDKLLEDIDNTANDVEVF